MAKTPRLSRSPRAKPPSLRPFYITQRGAPGTFPLPLVDEDVHPDWWLGTNPEWWVYKWLLKQGLREGQDFQYQEAELGGRPAGGAVGDFAVQWNGLRLLWRAQGYHWHFALGGNVQAQDFEQRRRLEAVGLTVVDLLDKDLEDPQMREEVLTDALVGVEWIGFSPHIFSRIR